MRILKLFLVISLMTAAAWAQNAIAPENGSGTPEDPFQIESIENLYWITQDESRLSQHYVQMNDLNADSTKYWFPDGNGGFLGWLPIGHDTSRFMGSYDGGGYLIENLFIGRDSTDNVALFGYVSNAYIHDLGLTEIVVRGRSMVGGLVGRTVTLTIERCFVSGEITGINYTGGVVAALYYNSNMSQCYSKGSVWARQYHAGGVVGFISGSNIFDCYNFSSVYCHISAGGLAGSLSYSSEADHCYSIGRVSGTYDIGGLIGQKESATIRNSFWDKELAFRSSSQGGTAKTTEEMKTLETYTDAGWAFDSTWSINVIRNNGYPYLLWESHPLIEMLDVENISRTSAQVNYFLDSNFVHNFSRIGLCWNTSGNPSVGDSLTEVYIRGENGEYISHIMGLNENTEYYICAFAEDSSGIHYTRTIVFETKMFDQEGSIEDPYQVSKLDHLKWIMNNKYSWNEHYIQVQDINASATRSWDSGKGWTPLGEFSPVRFQGTYDGQGYAIDSLYINRPDRHETGFIGCAGPDAVLKNIVLNNIWIMGEDYVGGLAGRALESRIYNSRVGGFLEGNRMVGLIVGDNSANIYDSESYGHCQASYNIGGLTGTNGGSIVRCQNFASVKGWNGATGGLVGSNTGKLYFCINRGSVDGSSPTGGLVGSNRRLISNCYNTSRVISANYVGGLVGTDLGANTKNSYNVGLINTTGSKFGGIISHSYNDQYSHSYITACFWDTITSSISTSFAGTGKSTGEMKDECTFVEAGWNFNTLWSMKSSINNGYPHLFWEANVPKVKIIGLEELGADSAVVNCELFYLGDPHPDHYGICWDTLPDPDMRDNLIDLGAGDSIHTFKIKVEDLKENTKYYVRSFVDNFDGPAYGDTLSFTTLITALADVPEEFELHQNYPNPFNPITAISYQLSTNSPVELTIFDIAGRRIETLVSAYQKAGNYRLNWNASQYSSGVYFYRLETGEYSATKKMILMK